MRTAVISTRFVVPEGGGAVSGDPSPVCSGLAVAGQGLQHGAGAVWRP